MCILNWSCLLLLLTDDYYLSACMGVIRWVISRNRDKLNYEVLSDEEGEETPKPTPRVDESQNSSLPTDVRAESRAAGANQGESQDSLPQLVLPAVSVSNKESKTPRKGKYVA